jgi:hypothetical protein
MFFVFWGLITINEKANEKTWMWMKHAMTTRIQFSVNMFSCVLCFGVDEMQNENHGCG